MCVHNKIVVSVNLLLGFFAGNPAFYFGNNFEVSCRASAEEVPAESALQKPFLTASPQELIAVASKSSTDLGNANIEILMHEGRYCIDAQGRITKISRQVYRCITQDAFDQYGVVQAIWKPWHQDRPKISGRVITPEGQVHALNPKTFEEIRLPSGQENVFTDVKLLRAPLPALTVGCIVETRVIIREHTPFSAAGSSDAFQLGSLQAPTRLVHVVIEAPESIPLHYRVLRSDQAPVVKNTEDLQIVDLSLGPVGPLVEQLEANLPHDLAPVPMIRFSTVKSWHDVAREYAAIVQRQLAKQDLNDVVQAVLGESGNLDKKEIAALLLAHIQGWTRYTSISFGQAAIVPRKPRETLQRRYGDCKDLSTLLVSMLRAAGVKAATLLRFPRRCRLP